ncbi:MAG: MFS transporter [Spirochaetaceae bacterium]|nr:MFS transporter [Myxococcales bacterium]MCB9725631.1 MFS transporter [Spirochaetaceae bacterium]
MTASASAGPGREQDARQRRLARNPWLLCAHEGLMMALFPMAVLTVFQHEHLGLSVADVMVVQAAFAASLAILEFPSGYLADRIGYRRTMILASWTSIGSWGVYSVAEGFWSVVAAELLLGAALSLISGTKSALLYESLEELGRTSEFTRWIGRARFWAQVAEGSAALAAGLLFALSPRLPFQLMVGVWVVNLVVALVLVEPRYARHVPERVLAHVRGLIRYVAFERPRLRALFAVAVVLGLASFVPVWLVQLYARDAGVPVSWLGPIWAAANYTVALGALASERLGERVGLVGVLLACCGLVALGYLGMGLSHGTWGFVFYFAFNLSRGLSSPLLAHAEQREIPSGDRASLVSMRSLLFRGGFIALGPLVGALVDARGQHVVLLGLGPGFVTAGVVCCLALARTLRSGAERRDAPSSASIPTAGRGDPRA